MDSTRLKGYTLGALGAAFYGLNPLFALPLLNEGMRTPSILFFRYLLAIPLMFLLSIVCRKSLKINFKQGIILAVAGVLIGLSSLLLFESYRHMDAGIASTLLFVYPLMVAIINAIFFRERLGWIITLCLTLALVGIGLLYRGEGGVTLSFLGTMLVMGSSLSYAIYIVGVNRTEMCTMSSFTVIFYALSFGIFVFVSYFLFGETLQIPQTTMQWVDCAGLAIFPTALSFLLTTISITRIGSTPAAILGALEPVTAVLIGVAVFGEQLTPRVVCGFVLILGAVITTILAPSITARLRRARNRE